jgi:hypothetical protein
LPAPLLALKDALVFTRNSILFDIRYGITQFSLELALTSRRQSKHKAHCQAVPFAYRDWNRSFREDTGPFWEAESQIPEAGKCAEDPEKHLRPSGTPECTSTGNGIWECSLFPF